MKKTSALSLIGFLVSIAAKADDALPLFWVLGLNAFLWGTIWVLLSESTYFVLRFRNTSALRNATTVIIINALTTFLGVVWLIVAPNEIAIAMGGGFGSTSYEGLLTHPWYQVAGVLAAFPVGYISSFVLEALPLYFLLQSSEKLTLKQAIKHSAIFNAVSYAGLLILYSLFVTINMGKGL